MTSPRRNPAPKLEAGLVIGPKEIAFTRESLVRYAGASGDFNPIHWSDPAAEKAGLPGVIAHGMLTMGAAVQALVEYLGDPGLVAEYAVRFAAPVVVPAEGAVELTVTAKVTAVASDMASVSFTVTHEGHKVLGKAVAKVRLRG